MKSLILLSILLAEDHPPETMALDPFAGGASPFTTLLLVVLLIMLIWWLLRAQTGQIEPVEDGHHDHSDHAHHVEAEAAPEEPPSAEAPASTAGPDDLKVLEGVGPKVQSVLNAAGIETFQQLSGAEVEQLQGILDGAGYQYMNPASWPEQARLAAAGDWDALKKLQDELTAGRS